MNNNLRLVINNINDKQIEDKHFFEKDELKIILNLYARMVSEGSWKDYGLNISSKQVGFSVFKNATENALYKICKNFKPKNKNLKYLIIDCLLPLNLSLQPLQRHHLKDQHLNPLYYLQLNHQCFLQ